MENEKPILIAKNEYGYIIFGLLSIAFGIFLVLGSREEGYIQFSSTAVDAGILFLFLGIVLVVLTLSFPQNNILFFNDRLEVKRPDGENQLLYYKDIECWKENKLYKHTSIEIYTRDKLLIIKSNEHRNFSNIKKLFTELGLPYNANIESFKRTEINTDKYYKKWVIALSILFVLSLFLGIFVFSYIKTKNDEAISTEKIIIKPTLSEDAYIRLLRHAKSGRVDTSVELKISNSTLLLKTANNIFSVEQLTYIYDQLHKDEEVSLQILKVDYEYRIAKTKKPGFWYNHLRLGDIYIYGLQHKGNILLPFEK